MEIKIPWGLFYIFIGIAIIYLNNKSKNRKIERRNKIKAAQQEIIDNLIEERKKESAAEL
jgi:hypothetical protein